MFRLFIIISLCIYPSLTMKGQNIQTLSAVGGMKQLCLDICKGIDEKNPDKLLDCSEQLNAIKRGKLLVKSSGAAEGEALKGHVLFVPEFIDSLIVNDLDMSGLDITSVYCMRGSRDIFYRHYVLGGEQTGNFEFGGIGQMELALVAESGGLLCASVENKENSVSLQDGGGDGSQACSFTWKMPVKGTILLKVENRSNKPVGFIIISN